MSLKTACVLVMSVFWGRYRGGKGVNSGDDSTSHSGCAQANLTTAPQATDGPKTKGTILTGSVERLSNSVWITEVSVAVMNGR